MMLPNNAFQRTRKGQRATERWRWTISGGFTGRSQMRGCCTIIPVRNRSCLNGAKLNEDER